MREATAMRAMWQAKSASGEALQYTRCKGGLFSDTDTYTLRIMGKTEGTACVKKGTRVQCVGKNIAHVPRVQTNAYYEVMYKPDGANPVDYASWYCSLPVGTVVTVSCDVYAPDVMESGGATGWTIVLKNGGGSVRLLGTFRASPRTQRVTMTHTKTLDFKVNDIYYSNFYFGNSTTVAFARYAENFLFEIAQSDGIYEPYRKSGEIIVPCDLYAGDIWYPAKGLTVRADQREEAYTPQMLCARDGTVNVLQSGDGLRAELFATMLERRV